MKPDQSTASPRGGFLLHVMPALLYAALIFYGGSAGKMPAPNVLHWDKVAHLVGFAGMQLLSFRAVRYELPRLSLKWQLTLAVAIASVVGAALELYQFTLRSRSAEFPDWVADTVGAALAAVVLLLLMRAGATRSDGVEAAGRDGKQVQE